MSANMGGRVVVCDLSIRRIKYQEEIMAESEVPRFGMNSRGYKRARNHTIEYESVKCSGKKRQ